MANNFVFTIGHSNISIYEFLSLLNNFGIEVLVDVRSIPYSRYAKQFNKENLHNHLDTNNIKYLYMGNVIGGIPADKSFYINGKIDYDLLRQDNSFKNGINRLLTGIRHYRVAIMCAEENPMQCHRRNLISKSLYKEGIEILHIRANRTIEKDGFADEKVKPPILTLWQ